MDILIVNLIVAFACALCIKYIANSQINKFAKVFFIILFLLFIFFGFFVFVFFLTFLFLALIKKKYRVKIHKIDEKITYEKVEISKNDKFLFASKARFFATLMVLFFTCGFVFDGFKAVIFYYDCLIKKDYKFEILDNNYTLSDIEIKNWRWKDSQTLYIHNKPIGKWINNCYMEYNPFISKMLSIETDINGASCDSLLGNKRAKIIQQTLKENLINTNLQGAKNE
ncbi:MULTISPECIES: hypothetical protein [unclassified Campylobacter]|uniref:hypothetical protein n=1 Tax=unclassified Campylobacter TaxID=2593542 RepID=UPI0022E9FDB1|nr:MULTISPECIES: hypothetical protein [unclassified Campylobacter]MDA3062531.1 hypothetical protein [Campylobacter sp. JMF_14 EL1]MDA3073788.1 hypothetical protein [Campylobacter sp. JMF_10 EL2]